MVKCEVKVVVVVVASLNPLGIEKSGNSQSVLMGTVSGFW